MNEFGTSLLPDPTFIKGFKDGMPLNVWDIEDILYGFLSPWDVSYKCYLLYISFM